MIIPRQPPRRSLLSIIGVLTALAIIYTLFHLWSPSAPALYSPLVIPNSFATVQDDYPFNKDLDDGDFGELGLRVQILSEYYAKADSGHKKNGASALLGEVEAEMLKLFPWLRTPGMFDPTPLKTLRKSYQKRGIVIPVGKSQFRFAAHLITALRSVLNSELDIAIAYAGDADLPLEYRTALTSLDPAMTMLDISKTLNEEIIQVAGSWSIKPFAMLASPFTETILLDADSVLFQDPKIVFEYEEYKQTGTYFFHDRLLWRHAYRERHDWWEKEVGISLGPTGLNQNNTENWAMGVTADNAPMLKPVNTKAILKSKPYMEDWAEEMDSGMVVYDKSRLVLLMGLLHICWQNTPRVRDITYERTYGDKESWWFGLELCGVEYAFEPQYGSIVGEKQGDEKVCSFTIAHPDTGDKEGEKMLWYNGSLLRNKAINKTEYIVPEFWMNGDAQWLKGATKPDMSCLTRGKVQPLLVEQIEVIRKNVEGAKKVDERFRVLIGL